MRLESERAEDLSLQWRWQLSAGSSRAKLVWGAKLYTPLWSQLLRSLAYS